MAIERQDGPSSLALSRQSLPFVKRGADAAQSIRRGGYVLSDMPDARAVIIGTGSETSLAIEAQRLLAAQGVATRVVSMPCTQAFDRQDAAYQASVLPPALPAVAVEAAHPDGWRKFVGRTGEVIGIASYGESAPAQDLYAHFGITAQAVADAVQRVSAGAAARIPTAPRA